MADGASFICSDSWLCSPSTDLESGASVIQERELFVFTAEGMKILLYSGLSWLSEV